MTDGTAPELFTCEVVRNGGHDWVRPTGDLDLDTVQRVDVALGALREEGAGNLVLDLRGLTFMDSTGLRVLLKASKMIDGAGGKLVLREPSDPVRRLLEVLDRMDDQSRDRQCFSSTNRGWRYNDAA